MMVSIIIPVYNVEDYIMGCLQSVVAQTYTDYEVILVDDCGTDGSMDKAERFIVETLDNIDEGYNGNREKWRIVRHERNCGLSTARNTGTAEAKGKYIYYLDSDDTITPDCLEKLVAKAERAEADLVTGDIRVKGDDKWIPKLKTESRLNSNSECFHSFLQGRYYMMAWNKLVRRDFIERHDLRFVEGLIHEDQAWSFSVACVAEKIDFVNDETYNYLIRDNSIQTDRDFTKHFNAYCYLIKYYVEETRKYGKDNDTLFRWWLERQKALCFGMTLSAGTKEQLHHIYHIIRRNIPQGKWSKASVHYLLPEWLGILAYKKWHGMWLM